MNQGWGSRDLLKSYQYDRKQVPFVNSQQSVKNGIRIFALLKKLGLGYAESVEKAKENLYKRV
jgi:hypothetical protein